MPVTMTNAMMAQFREEYQKSADKIIGEIKNATDIEQAKALEAELTGLTEKRVQILRDNITQAASKRKLFRGKKTSTSVTNEASTRDIEQLMTVIDNYAGTKGVPDLVKAKPVARTVEQFVKFREAILDEIKEAKTVEVIAEIKARFDKESKHYEKANPDVKSEQRRVIDNLAAEVAKKIESRHKQLAGTTQDLTNLKKVCPNFIDWSKNPAQMTEQGVLLKASFPLSASGATAYPHEYQQLRTLLRGAGIESKAVNEERDVEELKQGQSGEEQPRFFMNVEIRLSADDLQKLDTHVKAQEATQARAPATELKSGDEQKWSPVSPALAGKLGTEKPVRKVSVAGSSNKAGMAAMAAASQTTIVGADIRKILEHLQANTHSLFDWEKKGGDRFLQIEGDKLTIKGSYDDLNESLAQIEDKSTEFTSLSSLLKDAGLTNKMTTAKEADASTVNFTIELNKQDIQQLNEHLSKMRPSPS